MNLAISHFRGGALVAVLGLLGTGLFAQAGRNDSTFVPSGLVNVSEFDGVVTSLALQPDGKVLTAGNFQHYNGISRNQIARLDAAGNLDGSFDTGVGFDGEVDAIALQADGKIVVGGFFYFMNGVARNRIARLNTDGSLDTSFDPGTGFDGNRVYALAIQPDGKIIVGGEFENCQGTAISRIARLNTNGSLDLTFSPGPGITDGRVQAVAIQPDGKVVVGGYFFTFNGLPRYSLLRLNTNGSLDVSFNTGTLFTNARIRTLLLSPDGKIYAGGNLPVEPGGNRPHLARLLADGDPDTSFHTNAGFNNYVYALALQPDGKLLVGGGFTTYQLISLKQIARLFPNGDIDGSFQSQMGNTGEIDVMVLQPDGNLIVGGTFDECGLTAQNKIARLLPDGNRDISFHARLTNEFVGFNGLARTIAIQPDGKLIIGGEFNAFCNIPKRGIVRLLSDGGLDNTFDLGTGVDHNVHVVVLQPDGKIIIGGKFRFVNNVSRNRIARLNPNGSLDLTFDPILGFDGSVNEVNAVALQPDGKIIVAGWFETIQGYPRSMIARLNADGSLDPTFDPGTGFENIARSLALQPDGKIIVGGWFKFFNGISRSGVARLNPNGSLDASFVIGTGFDHYVYSVALQQNGKVVIGGSFSNLNGIPQSGIARLNTDGSRDLSFTIGTGVVHPPFSGGAYIVAIQTGGAILVGGDFVSYNGVTRNRIARLHPDGTLDLSFITGTGFGAYNLLAIATQPDEKIVVAGNFSTYNGVTRYHIIRILNTLGEPLPVELTSFRGYPIHSQVALEWTTSREQNTGYFALERSQVRDQFEEIGTVIAAGNSSTDLNYQFLDKNALVGESIYRLRMVDMDGSCQYSPAVQILLKTDASLTLGQVFPNPASQEIFVELSLPESGAVQTRLLGLDGRIMILQNENLPAGFQTIQLDLSRVADGVYVVEVIQNGQRVFRKIVKR